MQPKVLFFISGIIGIVFLILVIALNVTEVINFGSMMAGIVVIMLIVILANILNWWLKSRQNAPAPSSKAIKIEQAKEIAKRIVSEEYSEIEREVYYEDIWTMGRQNTPIYVRLGVGDFDGNIINVLVNMENPEKVSHKGYDPETKQDLVERDVSRRANLLSGAPRQEDKHKVISSLDPESGKIIYEDTPISAPEEEEGGGLQ